MIVDADGAILGRLSTKIAKELLKGESIIVINSEKAVISGNPEAVFERFYLKKKRGDPHQGPFYPKYPDRLLRRVVRSMLPFKRDRGRKAFRRLKVYMGNPDNLKGEKISKTSNDLRCKFVTLEKLSRELGAKLG
jgi:large subunit ribosomal protein L13